MAAAAWVVACALALPRAAWCEERAFDLAPFGTVHVELPPGPVKHLAVFASGDGGWNLGVVDMARRLSARDTAVVGFSTPRYLAGAGGLAGESCTYAAADLEALSQRAQRFLALPDYTVPVLVGYSSGATLVYAALAQAPAGTFRGAVSLGFGPDLPLKKPFCRGRGLAWAAEKDRYGHTVFLPAHGLPAPWVVLQGEIDQVVDPAATRAFVEKVPGGEVVSLPHVGHGYGVPRNWAAQFTGAFARLADLPDPQGADPQGADPQGADARGPGTAPEGADVAGLPLIEVPARAGTAGDTFAVFVSGDGGWAELDRDVSAGLAEAGVPVIGLNALRYFWTPRSPEQAAADLARIVRHYGTKWGRSRVILAGYSRGADVLPFMAAALPDDLKRDVALLALLGPGPKARFAFHLADWLGPLAPPGDRPVAAAVEALWDVPVLCVYGTGETDSACTRIAPGRARRVALAGEHHFGGDYAALTREILRDGPAPR